MDILEKLFVSPVRVRLLRLFLMNPGVEFTAEEARRRSGVRSAGFLAETKRLQAFGILRIGSTRIAAKQRARGKKGRRAKGRTVRAKTFSAATDFPLFTELKALVAKSAPGAKVELAERVRRLGSIKLAVLAGVFIESPNSRVDLLLVGDGMRKARLRAFIQWLEGQVGRELSYVAMSPQEFRYRLDMYDRFVRDIIESPHETLIDKLGV